MRRIRFGGAAGAGAGVSERAGAPGGAAMSMSHLYGTDGDDGVEMESFEVSDWDLQNEFNPHRQRHRQTKEEATYGVWAERDSDEERPSFGGKRYGRAGTPGLLGDPRSCPGCGAPRFPSSPSFSPFPAAFLRSLELSPRSLQLPLVPCSFPPFPGPDHPPEQPIPGRGCPRDPLSCRDFPCARFLQCGRNDGDCLAKAGLNSPIAVSDPGFGGL